MPPRARGAAGAFPPHHHRVPLAFSCREAPPPCSQACLSRR
jgi:hypothetical protein